MEWTDVRERMRRLVPRRPAEWVLVTLAGLVLLAWIGGAAWLGSAMFNEHNPQRAHFKCERPAGVFGTSAWQWWPPGRACYFRDGTIAEPTQFRSLVIVVLTVIAVVGIVLALLYARRKGVLRARPPDA